MTKLIVDGTEIEADPSWTLLQACEAAGREIPRFCYHERLSVAGNCRMCLVEWVGAPKPQASCALSVRDLRPDRDGSPPKIRTNSPTVRKAREGVMEFLLINHPLDCPICDQGGECDLQDQAMAYGVAGSRYQLNKRAVEDKYMGPLVKTSMTRCIQCTRCVRFATEVAGVPELGLTGRGEDVEITTYLERALTSELSGNVIDLCPVGALTSKPYAFAARPWELRKTETIDVMDAVGCNIRVDVRGRAVMRILPRLNEDVNEEWISDKARFVWDGLGRQRLDQPYLREGGKLRPATWGAAFARIAERVSAASPGSVAAIAGDLAPVEPLFALKTLMAALGGRVECRVDGAVLPADARANYVGDAAIADIDDAAMIQLIGVNPRVEAPVINARLRKAVLNGAHIGVIGERADLTYPYAYVGAGRAALKDLAAKDISAETREKPTLVILGQAALAGEDAAAVLALTRRLVANTQSKLLILHTAASRVGALDVGFTHEGGLRRALAGAEVVWNLGADEIDMGALGDAFVIYQGGHGDAGAHRADVILPAAAWTEQSGLYVNTEGRPQMANRAVSPPGEAREDWAILRAAAAHLGATPPWDNLGGLRKALIAAHPHFGAPGARPEPQEAAGAGANAAAGGRLSDAPFVSPIRDFYLTNPVARASRIMAECSQLAAARAAAA